MQSRAIGKRIPQADRPRTQRNDLQQGPVIHEPDVGIGIKTGKSEGIH
jgi:hypothetical protein